MLKDLWEVFRVSGIPGAVRLGCRSVLVLTGFSTRADLAASAVQPDLVVETLDELVAEVGAAG